MDVPPWANNVCQPYCMGAEASASCDKSIAKAWINIEFGRNDCGKTTDDWDVMHYLYTTLSLQKVSSIGGKSRY